MLGVRRIDARCADADDSVLVDSGTLVEVIAAQWQPPISLTGTPRRAPAS